MTHQRYCLILILRVAGSDAGTTPQTWTVTADTPVDAVKLAKFHTTRIPGKLLHSAILAEMMGKVIWRKEDRDKEPGNHSQRQQAGH